MKHTISRFFRFFLVAALVAAMAGSLLPSKALGQTVTATTTVTPSGLSTLTEMISWTIVAENHAGALTAPVDYVAAVGNTAAVAPVVGSDIIVVFPDTATLPTDDIDDMHVTVNGEMPFAYDNPDTTGDGNDESMAEDIVEVTAQTVTIQSPVAAAVGDRVEIKFSAAAGISHGSTGDSAVTVTLGTGAGVASADDEYTVDADPTVVPNTYNAGATAQWKITFLNGSDAVTADNTEITLAFGDASVPSSIVKTDIAVQPVGGATALLKIDPSSGGKSLSFFSPTEIAADTRATIFISARAGIAHGGSPKSSTVDVTIGTATKVTSDPFDVNAYLSISPIQGPRNTVVTVSGGGFTPGTSGSVLVGPAAAGNYTVDSAGKLTGSFVANKGTGEVSVRDLGSGASIDGPKFTQTASASPAATEVSRGGSVKVKLYDFPKIPDDGRLMVTATIGGTTAIPVSYITSSSYTLNVPQSETPGTKQVSVTGQAQMKDTKDNDDPEDDEYVNVADGSANDTFLITVISRTLVVSPSSAVPGQAVTVSGAGFGGIASVDLTLTGDSDPVDGGRAIKVNTDGTFLYTGKVPFTSSTATAGSKTWTARATGEAPAAERRAATSSAFSIQARSITLSPGTANPGSTVNVFGAGFGVKTDGNVTSQVTITVTDTTAIFGPFPISSTGEFRGAFTVPADVGVKSLTVTAKDNNGTDSSGNTLTDGFDRGTNDDPDGNQSASKSLSVPTGVISVSPNTASTGSVITVSGSGFPAQTNLSALSFGDGNALPVPAPATDVTGNFTVTLTVPAAAQGGSLPPGAVVITAKVGQIQGTISFTIPGPSISLSSGTASPGSTITVSGSNFGAYANVGTINVGQQNQAPTPNPLTDATGNFSASVLIPALNPGAYTVTVRTAPEFTATHAISIVSSTAGGVSPEVAFQALTSRGILTLAAAASPGGTEFGAFVPGLAGNTLVQVDPNGVLILTLNTDARISVSSQPAVSVKADTPTFFALGANVSVEVIE